MKKKTGTKATSSSLSELQWAINLIGQQVPVIETHNVALGSIETQLQAVSVYVGIQKGQ